MSWRPRRLHHGLVLLLLGLAVWRGLVALAELGRRWEGVSGAVGGWRYAVLAAAVVAFLGAAGALWVRLRMWRVGLWQDASAAPFRLLVYCAVLGWVAQLVLFERYAPLEFQWLFAVTLGAWGLLMLAAPLIRRALPARALVIADLALFYLVVLAVGGELGLRTLAAVRPSVLLAKPDDRAERRLEAGRYPPGTVRYGFPVNSTGHYDEEFLPKRPDQKLVVTIGDSFSAGVVPHYYHFTTVAERALGGVVTIDNVGVPSVDPPEYLQLLLREALPLRPDAVVIDIYLGNDVSYRMRPPGHRRLAGWLDRENILLLQVPRRLVKLAREGDTFRKEPMEGANGGAEIIRTPAEIAQRFPWVADPLLEQPTLSEATYLEIERGRFGRLSALDADGIARRLAPLLTMRRAAGGTPVAVMVIPDEMQVNDRLWEAVRPPDATESDRLESLELTRRWLEAHGFAYLDLYPLLRAVQPLSDGCRHVYKLRDSHFNVRGNEVAGEALAGLVARLLGLRSEAGAGNG